MCFAWIKYVVLCIQMKVWVFLTGMGNELRTSGGPMFRSGLLCLRTHTHLRRENRPSHQNLKPRRQINFHGAYCWMNHYISTTGGFFNQNSLLTFSSFKCSIDKSINWIFQGSTEDSPGGLLPISSLVGKSAFRCHVIWNSRRPCLWVTGCDRQKSTSTQHRQNSFQPRAHYSRKVRP